MENIHVLPTDKPSRLHKIGNEIGLTDTPNSNFLAKQQNIYITNDEEIKKGDWVYLVNSNTTTQVLEDLGKLPHIKKIILTTDQDLIKDGVQAIDDEFLEWFAKNPSCESVVIENRKRYEFEHLCDDSKNIGYTDYSQINPTYKETSIKNWNEIKDCNFYKIIIPKEEHNSTGNIAIDYQIGKSKEIQNSMLIDAETAYNSLPKEEPKQDRTCANNCSVVCGECQIFEPKQETLEEVAERIYPIKPNSHPNINWDIINKRDGFIYGYQLAQQQNKNLYSEEDLHNAFYNGWIYRGDGYTFPKAKQEWFEQFKKK